MLLMAAGMMVGCASTGSVSDEYLGYVEPRIGTAHCRYFHFAPGAMPFGMAKPGPSTNGHLGNKDGWLGAWYVMSSIGLSDVVNGGELTIKMCEDPDAKIRSAVENHLAMYPKAHLQDLYKAFFQAEFGAEHIVADTASAGRYLDRELAIPDHSPVLYEPVGADSTYYRVHLRAVQEGHITRRQLFDLFVNGVSATDSGQISLWKGKWARILRVIETMGLDLPDIEPEKAAIDSLLDKGEYAFHHSDAFREAYEPHYRIIRRDLFLKSNLQNK